MAKQKLEIECPVCDAKISIDARSCHKCGADLGMADFQDLENLANDISSGTASYDAPSVNEIKKIEVKSETSEIDEEQLVIAKQEQATSIKSTSKAPVEKPAPEKPKVEIKTDEDQADTEKKKGLFSKFFGKKK